MSAEPEEAGERRIASAFAAARAQERAALMPYLMDGFPDRERAQKVAAAYADAGADVIELGVPFSDPLADGPVIHAAAADALAGGATLESALETCSAVGARVPVVIMCYANMVLSREPAAFASLLARAGAAGAIIPDLPAEESASLREALADAGIALIPLVAPTTSPARRRRICEDARGFVYLVSVAGVTGERRELPASLERLVAAVRRESPVPVAVGFGIATPEQAAAIGRVADGVIIGSRLVRAVAEAADAQAATDAVAGFLRSAKEAMG